MATSDSEDFESADEDLDLESPTKLEKPHELASASKEINQVIPEFKANDNMQQAASNLNSVTIGIDGNNRVKHARVERPIRQPKESKSGIVKKLGTRISVNKTESEAKKEIAVEDRIKDLPVIEQTSKQLAQCNFSEECEQKTPHAVPDFTAEKNELQKEGSENKSENKLSPVLDKLDDINDNKHKQEETEASSSWGGWGNWGMTSFISTATESVSTLTSHVSQGLTTVLETGIGAPDPETLAKMDKLEEQKRIEENAANEEREEEGSTSTEAGGLFGLGNLMSGVSSITRLMESTGSKVLTGGLDTLETIGKKTMEVLQEGDPGLKKKRALFSEKIVLSQVLREAKEKAEREAHDLTDMQAPRKVYFETLFDDYQGLVHLEALEMLSKQCDLKIQSVLLSATGSNLTEHQEALQELKDTCQLPDEEDEVEEEMTDWRNILLSAGSQLNIPISFDKLTKTWDETEKWLEEQKSEENAVCAQEVHDKAIASLAQMTAEAVEQFHKTAELLLVKDKRDPQNESQILLQITSVLTSKLSSMATRFSECLNIISALDSDSINELITNVFLEASNSSSYIQEAFQLLVPVLQVGLLP